MLNFWCVGTNRHDMEASVTSPSGVAELCDIQDLGTSQYSIKFVPKEMGIHTVSVKHRGMHIPGLFFAISFPSFFLYCVLTGPASAMVLRPVVLDLM